MSCNTKSIKVKGHFDWQAKLGGDLCLVLLFVVCPDRIKHTHLKAGQEFWKLQLGRGRMTWIPGLWPRGGSVEFSWGTLPTFPHSSFGVLTMISTIFLFSSRFTDQKFHRMLMLHFLFSVQSTISLLCTVFIGLGKFFGLWKFCGCVSDCRVCLKCFPSGNFTWALPVLLTFTVTVLFTLKDRHSFCFSLVLSECGWVVVFVAVAKKALR